MGSVLQSRLKLHLLLLFVLKQLPIILRMAFLVKYIAFVVAFLSAAKLGESIDLNLVDVTDADSVQAYVDMVRANACESFDPTIPDHMAAVEDDAATLAHLLQLHYHGDNIEICTPKEGDRILISGTVVALGAWGAKAAGSAAIGWGINKWFG